MNEPAQGTQADLAGRVSRPRQLIHSRNASRYLAITPPHKNDK
jgi:hypothetical protein